MAGSPFDTLISREADLKHIIDRYGPLSEEVPCGLQNCRTKNGRGFIVAFVSDGVEQIGAIGRDCGRTHFGTEWIEQQRIFRRQEHARALQDRLKTFLPEADSVMAEMQFKLSNLRDLQEKRQQLEARAPDFFASCVEAIRANNGRVGENFQIEGAAFFMEQAPLTPANILKADIGRVQGHIERARFSAEELALKASDIGNIRKRWEAITDWMSAAERALNPEHLARIVTSLGNRNGDEIRVSLNRKWVLVWEKDLYQRRGKWEQLMYIAIPTTLDKTKRPAPPPGQALFP